MEFTFLFKVKKVDALLALNMVDYQDILDMRNAKNALEGGLDANLLDDMGKFADDTLENNYQAYVNRKISKGQTPKDRLEWKKASDYWTKESPVARGNNFNKTVREADIYDYHEVYLENGKRLDSYAPDAGEIISRKATDLDKIKLLKKPIEDICQSSRKNIPKERKLGPMHILNLMGKN